MFKTMKNFVYYMSGSCLVTLSVVAQEASAPETAVEVPLIEVPVIEAP